MKKQITFETISLILSFVGIVYAVFASSFFIGFFAVAAFVAVLVSTLKEA